MKSLDVMAQCGIDWFSDSHPWGGETAKMNALGANDKYEPGPLVRKFLEHARKIGVNAITFTTMNNSHPWIDGKPFRQDQPDWVIDAGAGPPAGAPDWRKQFKGNCMGNRPFSDWLERTNLEALANGRYPGWCVDGDFFGGPGLACYVVPVNCQSDKHDHLAGRLELCLPAGIDAIDGQHPPALSANLYFGVPADDGSGHLVAEECGCVFYAERNGYGRRQSGRRERQSAHGRESAFITISSRTTSINRCCSRGAKPGNWPGKRLDYILLSALSSSPNQLYLPAHQIRHSRPGQGRASQVAGLGAEKH